MFMPAVTGLLAGCDALLRVAGGAPLGPPVEPWEPDGDSDQNPWASALEWACAAAEGSADQDHAARAITEAVNTGGYFHYDDEYGAPHYSERSTNSPYAYRERLARPGLVGYDRCLARPETRKRRRVE